MFNFITLARKALLAFTLVLCSGAALAGPNYLVTLHTQAYSGESGLLDFSLLGNADAPGALARLWNFSGAFGEEFDRSSSVTGDLASGLFFSNSGPANYLTQSVILGDDFSFMINFSGDYEVQDSPNGITFAAVLYDAGMSEMWDVPAQFDLVPAFNGDAAMELVTTNPDTATVTVVPEPSAPLLILSALALAGLALRRKA